MTIHLNIYFKRKKILKIYNLPELTKEKIENLNSPITFKEIETVVQKNFPKQKIVA